MAAWRPGDELRGGASNEGDEWVYGGISPDQARRIADGVEEAARLTGGAPPSDGPTPGPRRNLQGVPDGYADPRR